MQIAVQIFGSKHGITPEEDSIQMFPKLVTQLHLGELKKI